VVLNDANYVKVKSQPREENTSKILRKRVTTKTQITSNGMSASPKSLLKRRKKHKNPYSPAQKRKYFKGVTRLRLSKIQLKTTTLAL
jgi:hypothetical protein